MIIKGLIRKPNGAVEKPRPESFTKLGTLNFIETELVKFWKYKSIERSLGKSYNKSFWEKTPEEIYQQVKTNYAGIDIPPNFKKVTVGALSLIAGTLGAYFCWYLSAYFNAALEVKIFATIVCALAGLVLGIEVGELSVFHYYRHKTAKEKAGEASSLKNNADDSAQYKLKQFRNGTNTDRISSVLEWINDPTFGLLAQMNKKVESAKGDTSGFLRNQEERLNTSLITLDDLRKKAQTDGLIDLVLELDELRDKILVQQINLRSDNEDTKLLQQKLQQAEARVSAVKTIAIELTARLPIETEVEKIRALVALGDGYQSQNSSTIAGQSLQSALNKLEEVIMQSEQLEDGLNQALPEVGLKLELQAGTSPIEKMLTA